MKARELKKRCANITMAFDQLKHNIYSQLREEGTIQTFSIGICENMKLINDIVSKVYENGNSTGDEGTELEYTLCDLEENLFHVGFALGYCIGQDFDVPHPDVQKDIQAIKKLLQEERLLPYFSRERQKESGSRRSEGRVSKKVERIDTSNAFIIEEIGETLFFTPEGQFVLDIEDEIKSLSREEARAWFSEHDPGASFEKKEREAQRWLKDLQKEKKAA